MKTFHVICIAISALNLLAMVADADEVLGEPAAGHPNMIGRYAVPPGADDFTREFLQVFREGTARAVNFVCAKGAGHEESLLALLNHPAEEVQTAAIESLGCFGQRFADRLVDFATRSRHSDHTYASRRALERLGAAALPAIVAEVLIYDSYKASYLLGSMEQVALPALVEMLQSANPRVRRRAAVALAMRCEGPWRRMYTADATAHLVRCLDDPDLGVVALAVMGIQYRAASEAAGRLDQFLADPNTEPALRTLIEDALFVADRDVNDEAGAALPVFDVKGTEIPSDRDGFIHREFSLLLGDKSFFLGRLYDLAQENPTAPDRDDADYSTEGIDTSSVKVQWLVPERILVVTWTTLKHARFDTPADSTLLLATDANGWHEAFRGIVPGYSGYLNGNSEQTLKFDWNGRRNELRLTHTYRTFAGAMFADNWLPLLSIPDERGDQTHYSSGYAFVASWPCQLMDNRLLIDKGHEYLHLGDAEFPVATVIDFLRHEKRPKQYPEGLNPQFREEWLYTGRILVDLDVPPFVPVTEHRYLWSSHK